MFKTQFSTFMTTLFLGAAAIPLVLYASNVLAKDTERRPIGLEKIEAVMNFNTQSSVRSWRAINDGVMGGRSSGGPSFFEKTDDQAQGHMVFSGVINTNGGGFSSIRKPVPMGVYADVTGLILKVRSDGRLYKLSIRTDVRYRGRLVAFQAPIPPTQPREWAEVSIAFKDLSGSLFGRPLRGAPFFAGDISEIGFILADGKDGPFNLDLQSITPQWAQRSR